MQEKRKINFSDGKGKRTKINLSLPYSSESEDDSPVMYDASDDSLPEEWNENECVGCGEDYNETKKCDEWFQAELGAVDQWRTARRAGCDARQADKTAGDKGRQSPLVSAALRSPGDLHAPIAPLFQGRPNARAVPASLLQPWGVNPYLAFRLHFTCRAEDVCSRVRWCSGLTTRLPPRRTRFDSLRCRSRIFAWGSRDGQCRWSAGFSGISIYEEQGFVGDSKGRGCWQGSCVVYTEGIPFVPQTMRNKSRRFTEADHPAQAAFCTLLRRQCTEKSLMSWQHILRGVFFSSSPCPSSDRARLCHESLTVAWLKEVAACRGRATVAGAEGSCRRFRQQKPKCGEKNLPRHCNGSHIQNGTPIVETPKISGTVADHEVLFLISEITYGGK
ncbi:hypothetical protein PR048_017549 [Dryococelus australis]|uniref:Uncharacterized protein n=1 Tax=Dryococelus australis TaxID=614101 RepID=A0ABQ9HA34_9NEOP|nr:hypothetical protein PR048_017549 [Dryococelus australis]